jgi:fumarate hydratase class II
MNANEVIAALASRRLGRAVHPNDDVNMSQSSNDVIPTAIHVSAALEVHEKLIPALEHLAGTIERRSQELAHVVTTGRTHLMDAVPITFGQALGGWASQVRSGAARLRACDPRVLALAQGGTAVGTGINAHPQFAAIAATFARVLAQRTGLAFRPNGDFFEALSSQDAAVELSGQLRTVAVSIMKIANDLRWMNSGPLAGLGEIALPSLQPGSSIMPGKVNPVIAEAAAMVAAQVIGNDVTIAVAGQSGNFQLNVMLPVIAYDLLESIGLLAGAARVLADKAIAGFRVNEERLKAALARNPILVTALNPVIGYEQGAAIAKKAYAEGRPVFDVAREMTSLSEEELRRLMDPVVLTRGGIGRKKT